MSQQVLDIKLNFSNVNKISENTTVVEKVAFNIASEASYAYNLGRHKSYSRKAKNGHKMLTNFDDFFTIFDTFNIF